MSTPKFGLCLPLGNAAPLAAARDAGFEYIEAPAVELLQAANDDDGTWTGPQLVHASPLPVLACNGLLPPTHKITGLHADPFKVHDYLEVALRRAQSLGLRTLVFGSGAARNIPDEFDSSLANRQVIDFLEVISRLGRQHDVTIAIEHLHRGETNVLNSLAEATAVARSMNQPRLKVLLDTYHLWTEDEPLDHVRDALPLLAHVHVADRAGRLPPGEGNPPSDYRPLFGVLKRAGYCGTMSVEALNLDPPVFARVLQFLKAQWNES